MARRGELPGLRFAHNGDRPSTAPRARATPELSASPATSKPTADLILIVVLPVAVFAIAAGTELSERLVVAARGFERLQLDELPLALLSFSLGLAWFAWRRWREMVFELERRQSYECALAHQQNELRELSRRMAEAQETERRLLAHELHDELGQTLNAIKIEAVTVRNASRAALPEIHRAAVSVIALSDHVYAVVRDMTSRLRPVALDELGLVGALDHGVAAWRERAPDITFEFTCGKLPVAIDESIAIALYRVVQESLTNILRHAAARRVAIELEGGAAALRLSIRDDGRGVELGAIRHGLGLLGMRERIEGLGGNFCVTSRPGTGFRIDATVPLGGAEPARSVQ